MANDRIWITRTEPSASRLAHELGQYGYECIVEPILEIKPIVARTPNTSFDLVVYLSSHAVRHINTLKHGTIATMAVGDHTAETLNDYKIPAQIPNVQTSEGLVDFIKNHYQHASTALIISGMQSRPYLADTLRKLGMLVEKCEVYARQPRQLDFSAIFEQSNVILIDSLSCHQIVQNSLDSSTHAVKARKHVIVPTDRIAKVTAQNPRFIVHISNGVAAENILHVLSKLSSHVGS